MVDILRPMTRRGYAARRGRLTTKCHTLVEWHVNLLKGLFEFRLRKVKAENKS